MDIKFFILAGMATLLFMVTGSTVNANEVNEDPIVDVERLETEADYKQAYNVLKDRVSELKTKKKEAVTKEEKQQVKREIEETKRLIKEVKAKPLGGGIFIGSGVLLVIILLILIL